MTTIERYSPAYYDDVVSVIYNFYEEALKEYSKKIDQASVDSAIERLKDDAFLLIVNGKCEGVLAGVVTQFPISNKKVYQESIWYVNQAFRKYGVKLLKQAQDMLKAQGFTSLVMVCLHNSMTEKLFRFYQRLGFVPLETHFLRSL